MACTLRSHVVAEMLELLVAKTTAKSWLWSPVRYNRAFKAPPRHCRVPPNLVTMQATQYAHWHGARLLPESTLAVLQARRACSQCLVHCLPQQGLQDLRDALEAARLVSLLNACITRPACTCDADIAGVVGPSAALLCLVGKTTCPS